MSAETFTLTVAFRIGEQHRISSRVETIVNMGVPPAVQLTPEELQDIAFAAKMATIKVLRARKHEYTPGPKQELPNEHPDITVGQLRQQWLFQSQQHEPPEDFADFVEKSMHILNLWFSRWQHIHKKVNPKMFRTKEEMDHFLRENGLKALGLWHAMRELRIYWREAGVWMGNPFEPDDAGKAVPNQKRSKS